MRGLGGFLGRWSRLKADARKDVAPGFSPQDPRDQTERGLAIPQGAAGITVGSEPAERKAAPHRAEAGSLAEGRSEHGARRQDPHRSSVKDLPPIESLTYESDFTLFLGTEVPEELRREALRRLWRSDPVLANLDGLNDYDEDYSLFGKVEETVRTLFQTGRGMIEPEQQPALSQREDAAAPAADAPGVMPTPDALAADSVTSTGAPETASGESAAACGDTADGADGRGREDAEAWPGPGSTAQEKRREAVKSP